MLQHEEVKEKTCANDDAISVDSADEALSEMLGFSMNEINESAFVNHEENQGDMDLGSKSMNTSANGIPIKLECHIKSMVDKEGLHQRYIDESICKLPRELSVPQKTMRRLTEELVRASDRFPSDKTFEKIKFAKKGDFSNIQERSELTRFENFVNGHDGWMELCNEYLKSCISSILGEEMVLYKEKLNLKPSGGSGFAPHVDSPSLRVALGDEGPQTFTTVMVAIDDMNEQNGCLLVSKGNWSEGDQDLVEPEKDSNPDAGGRAGAIPVEVANLEYKFEPIECRGGDIVAFNGWCPHRSSANLSPFSRRAVFLTYNSASEGDFHDMYYQKMKSLRDNFQNKALWSNMDHEADMKALKSVPC
mmetsp:Transcript_8528/g.12164  ORF Transcript_8528/g.12164 Transcript_8528/m.12164 type:complete len:362 (-) Transcript_8528:2495-3580(-)